MSEILFIVNPIAGGKSKKRVIRRIRRLMDGSAMDWELRLTEYPGHAAELASAAEAEYIVAVGGDGTVDEVAGAITGTGKVLGIVPCGSGDGLARHLHISHNVRSALNVIRGGRIETIDHATINGKPFFCTCGVGFDALVSLKFSKAGKRGLSTYISESLKSWKSFVPEDYILVADGKEFRTKAVLITVGNADQWGNEARITPLASLTDGLLDVTILKPFRNYEIPALAIRVMTGLMDRGRRVESLKCSSLTIKRATPGPAHSDGDPCELGEIIDISIVRSSLNVLVPERYHDRI